MRKRADAVLAIALLLAACRANKPRPDGQHAAAPAVASSQHAAARPEQHRGPATRPPSASSLHHPRSGAGTPGTPAPALDGTLDALPASKEWGPVTAAPALVRRALGPACDVRRIEPRFAGLANPEAGVWLNRRLSSELDALQQALFSDAPCDGATTDSPHSFQARYELGTERAGHVALELQASAYSGGAHPNNVSRCFVVALADGQLLSLAKLLPPTGRLQLAKEVTTRLALQHGVTKLTEAGFFTDQPVIEDDHALCLTPSGLRVQFQPYEVAPYALGFPAVELTFEEARSFFPRGAAQGLF